MWPFKAKARAAALGVKYAGVLTTLGRPNWLSHSYRVLAQEGFERNPVVYACVTKLARAAASVELQLYDHTRQGKLRKIERHPILDLIESPNLAWSGRQFREKLATHYLVGGDAFCLADNGENAPNQLWLLPPDQVRVDAPRSGLLPDSFTHRPGDAGEAVYRVNRVSGLSPVLHLRTVNPLDEWRGLPPLAAAAHGVDVFNAGQDWNKSLLQNDCRPPGVMQMREGRDGSPAHLTDDQFARLRDELDANFSGSANAGRPLLLEGGLEWKQMAFSARDMDHRETMLTNARFIAACYGTPPMLVNVPGESTYANYGEAKLAYWADTVLPFLGTLLDDLNRWLPALFGEKVFLWFDEEQVPALEPLRDLKSKRINASEFLTINEKRLAMGHEPHADPNADDILVNSKDLPLSKVGLLDPLLHPQLAEPGGGTKPADKPAKSTD